MDQIEELDDLNEALNLMEKQGLDISEVVNLPEAKKKLRVYLSRTQIKEEGVNALPVRNCNAHFLIVKQ